MKQRSGRALKDVLPAWFGWFFGGRAKLSGPESENAEPDYPSGVAVTLERTLQLSAAWACIRLLSETIAALPCGVYERGADDTRTPARRHPLFELLHNAPNADMTAVSFWQAYIAGMLTCGYGAAEKVVNGAGQLIAIEHLFGPNLGIREKKSSDVYIYHDPRKGTEREIRKDRVWITPAFAMDGRFGLSPIRYGAGVLGTAMAAEESAARWFGNGMRPAGVLKTDKTLNAQQREDMRENVASKMAGVANSGKLMVLEAGLSYQSISLPPEDAQLLQTRSFGIEEICRWFGVPPIMVGHSEKVTAWGTGIEQIVIGFLTFSLRPWLTRIEQSIRKDLFTATERPKFFAEFSVEGLLRADSSARAAFYSQMTQNGIYTRNEARRLENLPPVIGGDVLTVQSNLIAIDQLGSAPTEEQQLASAVAQIIKRVSANART